MSHEHRRSNISLFPLFTVLSVPSVVNSSSFQPSTLNFLCSLPLPLRTQSATTDSTAEFARFLYEDLCRNKGSP
jgi:hypothetical protein